VRHQRHTACGTERQHRLNRSAAFLTSYSEGRNVAIEYRRAEDQIERLPALAADLARRQVSLILAAGRPDVALAAKSVTTSIPIVFINAADPVQLYTPS
jgi:putative tryptophan/tyrosine transport system substrate-binding protein